MTTVVRGREATATCAVKWGDTRSGPSCPWLGCTNQTNGEATLGLKNWEEGEMVGCWWGTTPDLSLAEGD